MLCRIVFCGKYIKKFKMLEKNDLGELEHKYTSLRL